MERTLGIAARGAGWAIFAAAIVWPTTAILIRCVESSVGASESVAPSVRQWTLLGHTAMLAGAATMLALLISIPVAATISGVRAGARRASLAGLALVLLTPPMVFCFGWEKLLPSAVPMALRCVIIWALWATPIPAMFLAAGWARGGRRAYEAALLCASPARALLTGAWPMMRRQFLAAAVVLFTLFLGDYGVPHACGLTVFATELLGWASNSNRAIDTLRPALPGIFLVAVLMMVGWRWVSDKVVEEVEDREATPVAARWAAKFTLFLFIAGWVGPLSAMSMRLGSASALTLAAKTYGGDMAWSLVAAATAGVAACVMGHALSTHRAVARAALFWMLLLGALPGGLIGLALIAAFNRPATALIADHWPILTLCYLARFGWIAMLAAHSSAARSADVEGQAAVDGADATAIADRLRLPMRLPAMIAAAAIITALGVAEVPASSLVRVPEFNPIAHVIIEKFHRFEDAMLAALCGSLVATAGLAAWIASRKLSER